MVNKITVEELERFNELGFQVNNNFSNVFNLKDIIESTKSADKLSEDVISLVKQRLAILDKFIAANISSAFSKEALQELNQLMQDRSLFLESTRMSYSLSHPKFIEYLYSKELTDREVTVLD